MLCAPSEGLCRDVWVVYEALQLFVVSVVD